MEANREAGRLKPAFHGRGAVVLARLLPFPPVSLRCAGQQFAGCAGSLRHCSNVAGLELLALGVGIGSPSGFEGRW